MSLVSRSLQTPLGLLRLTAGEHGLREVRWCLRAEPPLDTDAGPAGAGAILDEAGRQLREYFARERIRFDLPLDPQGTPFQHRVWQALCAIPYGETRSYGQLAAGLGQPTATRAVGAANGRNPLPIIVPCHRVIGANGQLTGFGAGGVGNKRILLDLEARNAPFALLADS